MGIVKCKACLDKSIRIATIENELAEIKKENEQMLALLHRLNAEIETHYDKALVALTAPSKEE